MAKENKDFFVDIRALELNFQRGNIAPKDYEKFLKDLPDLAGQTDEIPAFEEPKDEIDLTFSIDS